jgi:hypothetical protein
VPRAKTRVSNPAPEKPSWALILIDGRPIRDKARKEYDKTLRDLERARQELERFERHDKPGFGRWLNRHFGALIRELRETGQKLEAKRELLFEIESEALLSNSSHARAYERVMRRREHPEPEVPAEPEGEASSEERSDANGSEGANPFAGFEEFFAEVEEDFEERFGNAHNQKKSSPESEKTDRVTARLKDLYRALVRRLHPDTQRILTVQKQEWWHQAQAAYQKGDVEQLQVILTLCEIDEQGTTAKTSVSLLTRITRQFKRSLRTLKKQLNECRRDPSWNFSNLQDPRPLIARTERSLREELYEIRRALEAICAQIESWARQSQMSQRRPMRRTLRSTHPEFLF